MTRRVGDNHSPRPAIWTRRAAFGGIAATGLWLSACMSPKYTIRYRLTLDISTPEGPRRGAGLFEQSTVWEDGNMPGFRTRTRGEAAWVGLPGGRNLLALLVDASKDPVSGLFSLSDMPFHPSKAFARLWRMRDGVRTGHEAVLRRLSKAPAGTAVDLLLDELPLLVTLPDTSAALLTVLDPADLEATMGEKFSIMRACLEVTHDPLVWILKERVPWLGEYRKAGKSLRFSPESPIVEKPDNRLFPDTIIQKQDWQ